MANIQNTYKEHVEECKAYSFRPLEYAIWLSWRVNKPIRELTQEDVKKHPKDD